MRTSLVTTALKIAFVAGFLAILISQDLLSYQSLETAFSRWPWVLAGWACMASTTVIAITRWHFLIRAQGIALPLQHTFRSALVGLFFNIILPGSLSGDLVKGYYVARAVPNRAAAAASSILFDRFIGLSGLVGLASLAAIAGAITGGTDALGAPIPLAVAGAGLGVAVLYGFLLGVPEERDPIRRFLQSCAERTALARGPARVYEGVKIYREHPNTTMVAITVSIVAHGFLVASWICFVRAMAIDGIPEFALFVVVPIGMLIATVPIGPAGIGTGHAAFLAIFSMLGSSRGADLFNLQLGFHILQACPGGLVYLPLRVQDPVPQSELESSASQGDIESGRESGPEP